MLKVGITGQKGFVGQHLYQTLNLHPTEFERIEFKREFFESDVLLRSFVAQCDVIVHLAGKNRHNEPQLIYDVNIILVKKLIVALESSNSKAHVLFSSSSQEERDNLYGKSKKDGRELFISWAKKSSGRFTGMVIPNIFGPFGQPYYNSFISTFSHQLANDEEPIIQVDSIVKLLYVDDLIKIIIKQILIGDSTELLSISHTNEYKVSEILTLLKTYKSLYFDLGTIPQLNNSFELNLFNTFRCYINISIHYPVRLNKNTDLRGSFVEIIRLNQGGQVSFSTTVPNVTRGNHFHTRKIERFAVIKGKALIQLRKIGTNDVINFYLDGDELAYVDMPVWYTHNIKNISDEELYTIFWINEFYNSNDPDTYFEIV